jgi:hypothetical protein
MALGTASWARGVRFNGCNITNSAGRDNMYWNKGQVQGRQAPAVASYFEDCTLSEITWTMGTGAFMSTGNKCLNMGGHLWSAIPFAANNYVNGFDSGYFRIAVAAMTLSYSGGGAATADKTGASDGGSLILKVNGSPVATYVLGQYPTDTWYDIQAIVTNINANTGTTGFSATFVDNSRRASALLGDGFGDTNGFTGRVITGTPTSLVTWFDQHSDLYQAYTGTGTRENTIIRGNTLRNLAADYPSNSGTNTFRFDAPVNDFLVLDSIFNGSTASSDIPPGRAHSHLYFRNTIHEPSTSFQTVTGDAYCVFDQCWLGEIGWSYNAGATPTPFKFKDSLINVGFQDSGKGTAFNTATNTGNSLHRPAVLLATYTNNPAAGDFRPRGAMPTKAKISTYDAQGNRRGPTDAIGAWALNSTLPIYAF